MKDLKDINESILKDNVEHGYEGYTENIFTEKVIKSFGCGCQGRDSSKGESRCNCKNKK